MTLFALMHEVQALMRCVEPLTTALTLWMFGIQRRFERAFTLRFIAPRPRRLTE